MVNRSSVSTFRFSCVSLSQFARELFVLFSFPKPTDCVGWASLWVLLHRTLIIVQRKSIMLLQVRCQMITEVLVRRVFLRRRRLSLDSPKVFVRSLWSSLTSLKKARLLIRFSMKIVTWHMCMQETSMGLMLFNQELTPSVSRSLAHRESVCGSTVQVAVTSLLMPSRLLRPKAVRSIPILSVKAGL